MLHWLRAGTTAALVGLLVMATIASVLAPVSGTRYTWRTEFLDASADAGRHSSLAIAANGTMYVLYHDEGGSILRLATVVGDTRSFEVVAGPGAFVGDTSLVLDARGDLHISYYDAKSTYVRYGIRAAQGGPWNLTNVDFGYFEGYNHLALDPLGGPRIAYTTLSDALRYALLSGSVWILEEVDPSALGANYVSLAIDRFGSPHIAYYGNGQLRYAAKTNLTWVVDIVDPRDYVGQFAQIDLDSRGRPRIAYYDEPDQSLWYAEDLLTGWSRTVIDGTGNPGRGLSLAIGSDDRPRVTYYAQYLGELRYAELVTGMWETQIVDEDYTVGWEPSLALDSVGVPHVTYYDSTRGALRHAVGLSILGARTVGFSDVTETGSLLRGEVTSLGGYTDANVSFTWRRAGEQNWQNTTPAPLDVAGPFEAPLRNLARGTRYEFRAIAEAGGVTETGRILTFTTSAPMPQDPFLFLSIAVAIAVAMAGLALVALVWFRGPSLRKRGDKRRDGPV